MVEVWQELRLRIRFTSMVEMGAFYGQALLQVARQSLSLSIRNGKVAQ